MRQIMGWMRRGFALFRRERLAQDHREELEFHMAMRERLNVEEGMPGEEARRDARRRFGNPVSWRERMREIDLVSWPGSIRQDLRYGVRMLLKHPGFTVTAVLALALGIGVNTAVFTCYKAVLARGLDAHDPGRMVNVSLVRKSGELQSDFSYPDYLEYRDHTQSFSGVIAESRERVTLTGAGGAMAQTHSALGAIAGKFGLMFPKLSTGDTEFGTVAEVSENYFGVLGETALRGRVFQPEDVAELVRNPAVLISENYWTRRFGADPSVLGRSMRINGASFTVVGITPHDFVGTGVATPDFWIPLTLQPLLHPGVNALRDREDQCCRIFARLADGVTMGQAQAEVGPLADHLRRLHDPHSELSKPNSAMVWPGSPFGRKLDSGILFVVFLVMLAVGMVLVIACANVASLQLARAASRQNELSMRLSLGASRSRIIRQLLTESALLGVLSGSIALLFTWGFLHVMAVEMSKSLPAEWGAFVMHVAPDMQIFAYVFALSLIAGVLFGLAPALESSRSALLSSLKANKDTSPARSRRLRDVLIAAQVAVCLVLMIAGSLLIRGSVHALEAGYEVKHVINLELEFPDEAKYNNELKRTIFREVRAQVEALPGVVTTTVGRAPDGGGVRTAAVSVDGNKPAAGAPFLFYTYVLPNYFQTLNIPLLSGRSFQQQPGAPEPAVVLSESAAAMLWPGQNALGRKIAMSTLNQFHSKGEFVPDGVTYQVVGISHDAGGTQLDGSDAAQIYVPIPEDRMDEHPLLIRTQSDPAAVIASVGSVIANVDPNVVGYTSTLEELLHFTPPFVVSRCAAAFASIVGFFGLLLACMGIYGTVSYMVVMRTHEVGIRMALGASRGSVLSLILRESTRPVIAGLGVGLVLAMGAAHLLHTLLYGLGPIDVASFAGVSALFLAIALLAAYVPSRSATRVDPVVALRYE
jgi:predicted permease